MLLLAVLITSQKCLLAWQIDILREHKFCLYISKLIRCTNLIYILKKNLHFLTKHLFKYAYIIRKLYFIIMLKANIMNTQSGVLKQNQLTQTVTIAYRKFINI